MSFNLDTFVAEPRLDKFNGLKKADLLQISLHYKLAVNSSMGKGDIKKLVLNYLVEEEIFPEEDLEHVALSGEQSLELRKLEYLERDKALQLKLKELDVREKELALEHKAKELELHNAKTHTVDVSEVPFDAGKHIHFVPPFQEFDVDKYFMHFEKVATSLKWPEDVWTVLLQSVFVSKAQEIYSALPVEHSARYQTVRDAVLKAYEQVPEAYRQKFRNSTKDDRQTYVEFAREKERLFDRWCTSQEVEGNYT